MTKYKGQYYWELIYNNLPSFLEKSKPISKIATSKTWIKSKFLVRGSKLVKKSAQSAEKVSYH